MTSMREKIAEAIWQGEWARGGNGGKRRVPWSEVAPVDQDGYRFLADAVLDALMEPTEGMLEYEIEPSDLHEKGDAELIWQAMILAAKEGK